MRRLATWLALATLPALAVAQPVRKDAAAPNVARFDWFAYTGHDAIYDAHPAGPGQYVNPILAGFYPDPSITRAGDDFYLGDYSGPCATPLGFVGDIDAAAVLGTYDRSATLG